MTRSVIVPARGRRSPAEGQNYEAYRQAEIDLRAFNSRVNELPSESRAALRQMHGLTHGELLFGLLGTRIGSRLYDVHLPSKRVRRQYPLVQRRWSDSR
jgi:hypothetical protein